MAPVRVRNGRFLQTVMTEIETRDVGLRETVVRLVEETIAGTDMFLVDVVIRGRQGSRVVEVFLDGDDGVGVDELAKTSRQVAYLLESEDLIRGKYHLNVSSPGAERALLFPRQYRKHEGKKIEIKVRSENPEVESVTDCGELVKATNTDLEIRLASGELRRVPFDEVEQAHIVMPW